MYLTLNSFNAQSFRLVVHEFYLDNVSIA